MQPFLQSPSTILSSISTIFLLSVSLHYLFAKPSIQSSQCLPSYITQLFFIFLLVTAIPTIPTKNPFSYLNHSADSGCFGGPMSGTLVRIYTILFSPCFPIPYCSESENLFIAHSGLLKMIAIRMGDLLFPLPSICYHYFYTLRIHITRSQIPLETAFPTDTIFIPSLAF